MAAGVETQCIYISSSPSHALLTPSNSIRYGAVETTALSFAGPQPKLKSGSRASQVPEGAPLGFRPASSIHRDEDVVDLTTENNGGAAEEKETGTKQMEREEKASHNSIKNSEAAEAQEAGSSKKSNTEEAKASLEEGVSKITKPPRKKRASTDEQPTAKRKRKRVEGESSKGQPRISAQVTKLVERTRLVFKQPLWIPDSQESEIDDVLLDHTSCEVPRRYEGKAGSQRQGQRVASVTTVQDSSALGAADGVEPANNSQEHRTCGTLDEATSESTPKFLTNLHERYAFNEQVVRPEAQKTSESSDQDSMLDSTHVKVYPIFAPQEEGGPSEDIPNIVVKRPAKSSRTVTGVAIGNFNGSDIAVAITPKTSVAKKTKTKATKEIKPKTAPNDPVKESDVLAEKPKPKRSRAKTQPRLEPAKPKPASPGTFKQHLGVQNLLYGTSSQLAIDGDADMIRQYQAAMERSVDDYISSREAVEEVKAGPAAIYPASFGNAKRRERPFIWSIAARDGEENLLYSPTAREAKDDFVDISHFEGGPKPEGSVLLRDKEPIPAVMLMKVDTKDNNENDFVDIESVLVGTRPAVKTGAEDVSDKAPSTNIKLDKEKEKHRIKLSSATSSFTTHTLLCMASPSTSFTEQRAKIHTIASNASGTGTPASSKALNKAKETKKDASLPTERKGECVKPKKVSSTVLDEAEPSKKPRGRPRKVVDGSAAATKRPPKRAPRTKAAKAKKPDTTKFQPAETENSTTVPDEDIFDSEPEPASPNKTSTLNAVQPLELSPSSKRARAATAARQREAERQKELDPVLFPLITKAVRGQPNGVGCAEGMSWYESILLYDPIVLEDFTLWLNSGPLREVGWRGLDGEKGSEKVDALDVQRWCEERSVCCYFKDSNWRSKR